MFFILSDRSSTACADFDQNTWIARLGMAEEEQADLKIGATVEGLPDVLCVRANLLESLKNDSHSMLGFRMIICGWVYAKRSFMEPKRYTRCSRLNEGTVIPWGQNVMPIG